MRALELEHRARGPTQPASPDRMAVDRSAGFAIADIDSGLLEDPKVRKLARRLRADNDLGAALLVYIATMLGSWGEGRRLTAVEAESWVEPTPERVAQLQEVGLLDEAARIPAHAWARWFEPAFRRRDAMRVAGKKGADRRKRRKGLTGDPNGEASWEATREANGAVDEANGVGLPDVSRLSVRPTDKHPRLPHPPQHPRHPRRRGATATPGPTSPAQSGGWCAMPWPSAASACRRWARRATRSPSAAASGRWSTWTRSSSPPSSARRHQRAASPTSSATSSPSGTAGRRDRTRPRARSSR